jgi:hypothetical protein
VSPSLQLPYCYSYQHLNLQLSITLIIANNYTFWSPGSASAAFKSLTVHQRFEGSHHYWGADGDVIDIFPEMFSRYIEILFP